MDFFNADEALDQDEEDKFATGYEAFRENVLFLIDASPAMLGKADIPDNTDFENNSWLEVAIKVVREVLKMRIISSDNDQLAVVFYGTKASQNANAFDSVYTFQDLDFPDAHRIRGLEQLLGDGFEEKIGSKGSQDPEHLHYALWTATQLLSSASSKSSKRVLIFTRDDNPIADAGNFREQILSRAQELTETKVVLELYPMIHQDQTFDMTFWSVVLQQTEGDLWEYEGSQVPYRLRNLAETVRHKAFRKRVLTKDLRWSFGNNFEIAVALYGMLRTAVKGTYTWLNAQNNAPLRAETAYICNDTGAVLTRANLTKAVFPNPSQYKTARYPNIILTTDELREVKTVQPRGLRLLGFKPTSMLMQYHQLRSPTFIYPDERSMPGSTQTFIAFHNRMLAKGVMAVCSFVRVKGGEPRIVALLAQEEVQDEYQTQNQPPGMHMIYLPFSDDLRHPEADPGFTGATNPQADKDQIAAAETMIHALNLKGFDSADIPNPSLQRHYQVLECYALNETPPEEIEDQTLPDIQGMSKQADKILAFRDAVYGEGNDETVKPKTAASRKRKTPEEEQAIKEQAAAIDYKGMAEAGNLSKLTVNDLKKYCEANQLPKSGKKDDVIERIKKHMGMES